VRCIERVATRRTLPFLLAAVAALAFAAPTNAKELTRVKLCGLRDDCATITDREQLRLVPMGGATSVAAPRPEPYYLMILRINHGEESEDLGLIYLPESNLLAANGVGPGEMVWLPISNPRSAELMRNAVVGIEPHPPNPGGWPHGLKSTYRVIPDDAAGIPRPSTPRNEAPLAPSRSEDSRPSAVWLVGAIVLAITAAAAVTLRSAVAPSGRRPAPRGFRLRGPGTRPL
jgi:hypothetical protein